MLKNKLDKKLQTSANQKPAGIYVYGAREHNLKSINIFIPHHQITVVTGLSGSGKSSLVFDTIFAEGQRRYVESLSSQARIFIEQLKKPDCDLIDGLCPSIAIDQRAINLNPRSTVGTLTEIYHYIRLLFAQVGTAHCPQHPKIPLKKISKNSKTVNLICASCSKNFFCLEPKLFSFNNPKGACPNCNGLGEIESDDKEFVSICSTCHGHRLKKFALHVTINDQNIAEWTSMSVQKLNTLCSRLKFSSPSDRIIAEKILEKITHGLQILQKIGLEYLSLNRSIRTLSGGEARRVQLAGQISSPLIGVLYVLDEPSIGLHARDQSQLLNMLGNLKQRGNTILLVEHDEKTIRFADHIIDLGPLAGAKGGYCIAQGNLKEIIKNPLSLTGAYLSGKKKVSFYKNQNRGNGKMLEIIGAKGNNLKSVHLKIPCACLVGIIGVSGSGKSTLIIDTLYKALNSLLYQSQIKPATYQKIKGLKWINKVIAIDQKPIGRTPRSVPATYIGILSIIRDLFSYLPQSREKGLKPGDFSFNIPGGRCEQCAGTGQVKQELLFLPTAIIPCEECQGRRYSDEILNIRYKGKNIYDILNMEISVARKFFANHYKIQESLKLMEQVGLSYLTLGQSSTTLSGGEAQRIKLTRELSKQNTGQTLYILDEPTTGLHFNDISQLINILKQLTQKNNTVIVVEHQMDVIKSCDWLIELGPQSGPNGGRIIAQGSPEKVAHNKKSATAPFLKKFLL